MGERNRQRVEDELSWDRVIDALEGAYGAGSHPGWGADA